jgi:hypothetical protein
MRLVIVTGAPGMRGKRRAAARHLGSSTEPGVGGWETGSRTYSQRGSADIARRPIGHGNLTIKQPKTVSVPI